MQSRQYVEMCPEIGRLVKVGSEWPMSYTTLHQTLWWQPHDILRIHHSSVCTKLPHAGLNFFVTVGHTFVGTFVNLADRT